MSRFLKKSITEDDGAVTVDWLVLTAAVVVLAAGVGMATVTAVKNGADKVSTEVSETKVD